MIEFAEFEEKLKKGEIKNSYIFCGIDEGLMQENIKHLVNKNVDKTFRELNYVQFDGSTVDMEVVVNTCETIPIMSDKKVVVVYRAKFLGEGEDREDNKKFDRLTKYLENVPNFCILIVYYVFENDREKPSNKIKKLDKKATVVKFDKLKGAALEKKVKGLFEKRGIDIGKIELKLFCDGLENNMNIINNEIDKLSSYTLGRQITKEDVSVMLPPKSDNDIFDLVDCISQKKPEKALDILNELIFKGEKPTYILFMIERQFNILFNLKLGVEAGKSKDMLSKELRLNPYICEKMIAQSKRFSSKQLINALDCCLNTEETLKSSSASGKIEMELLIIRTITA